MTDFLIQPGRTARGDIRVDGDKSISHRSIMFGSIAHGQTRIRSILEGEDVLATIQAFRNMGVEIVKQGPEYVVEGVGLEGLKQPGVDLDMGNSGTAFRLLTGLLTTQPWSATLCGDESLTSRPMGRIITPLTAMGGKFQSDKGRPPVTVYPAERLRGVEYSMPMASAQVKSAILLAALRAEGETAVREPALTRDHTERMLNGFGYPVHRQGDWVRLQGGGHLTGCEIDVPGDLSSATFFIVLGLISESAEIRIRRVGVNPSRSGVLSILQRMGADISVENTFTIGGEPVADIVVRGSNLRGIEIGADDIALAVDEVPAIAVTAACATGATRISGAEELRVKESDRIATTVAGLQALGIEVTEYPDGMQIEGGKFRGGVVESTGDHRIAMAFTIAACIATDEVRVKDVDCVNTSFPNFRRLAVECGLNISS